MSRFWKIALPVAAVVVVVVVLVARTGSGGGHRRGGEGAPGGGDDAANAGPVPVTVVAATTRDVPVYASALGTVAALNTVTVSPQVGGQLMSLNFREGDAVKKGQVLAQLDSRALQASYDQAAAAKRQNEALLATARDNYARSSSPAYAQYVAKTDLDTLRNQVSQYQAAVAADEASMRAAQVQLQFTKVVAPIDGIAGIRGVDAGNIVSTSSTIVTLTQIHPIYVTFNLPEIQLPDLRQAQAAGKVEVAALDRTDAHPLAEDGSLDVVNNLINSDAGTFEARAVFPNADGALWPGQFVNVRVRMRTIGGGVVVPAQAIQRGPDGDYVYLVQPDNTVKVQTVLQGVEVDDSNVQVAKGLKAGDRVVTEGQFRLKPGAKVQALEPGQTPAAPTDAELKAAEHQSRGGGRRGPPR
ncbi:efflux RND transporter periplasmic adaptor subunit [Xanthomonas massiliensis]|jgi:multidrug efflux system membrane fusion protein|uniref:efflux RND transporter periplasmic adaptor subunit n=1 Tax=Xanthomonas massiliensis TaxID=1720302 RepID=UPI0008251617|nr:efflux RND transporter periplasmic adaptor subunit [Xanthomonas massiliensis]